MEKSQDTSFGKTSVGRSRQTKAQTSKPCLKKSATSKTKLLLSLNLKSGQTQDESWQMTSRLLGECWMPSIGEFPNEENASSLSQILEENVPAKYYLSQRACLGILRRASERGKELPIILKTALEQQAISA